MGISALNSLSCGINEVCNLGLSSIPSASDCDPNCNIDSLPEEWILTWAPYEILAFAWSSKSELIALGSEELHALTLEVDISAILTVVPSKYRYLIALPSSLPLIVKFPNSIVDILALSITTLS